jgi:hypothetical protein
MTVEKTPRRRARDERRKRREEQRWEAKSSPVVVSKVELCEVVDCDGSCGLWHRL